MRAGRQWVRLGAAVLATGVVLAGCGGDESSGGGGGSAATPAPAATKAAKGKSGGGAAKSGTVKAAIKDFTFKPASITVKQGSKVSWTNDDSANHNVKFDSGPKSIDNLRKGQSGSVTFDKPGTYKYVCTYHPNMRGTIVVK